jgi:hypothetical protein
MDGARGSNLPQNLTRPALGGLVGKVRFEYIQELR